MSYLFMKHFIIVLIALTSTFIHAQKSIDPTAEDIIRAKELRLKYTKSDVALLYSDENITFDMNGNNVTVNNNVNERLMNINHRADIHKYETYNSQSSIENFSLKYRNGKTANFYIRDEFQKSEDLFYTDSRVKYMAVDFPVQGYTYNYELDKQYKDVKYFTSIYFQDEYPVLNKKITLTVPNWLELEIKEFNFAGYTIKKDVVKEGKNNVYTYILENLEPVSKEESAPGPSLVYPHLLIIAKSFTKGDKKITLFNDTADLYKWYKSLVDGMDENPAALKDKVKELTANAKTDDEKIKNIYYWVQDNIRYIAFEDGIAGFKPESSQNVFSKKYGDCKGMANLTRQMLKEAGFDARLTWIGTKHIGYDYNTPSLCVDNHMICTLFKDGKKYFLDGTEKYNSLGEYAERIQGKEVMIEDGEKYIIEKVPVAVSAQNKETYSSTFHIDNEQLVGAVSGNMLGESRSSFLYNFNTIMNDRKENALQYYLSHGDNNFAVSNVVTSDLTNRDGKLTIQYSAALKNKVSSFDNEMYVDLDYDSQFSEYDFKERKTDFEFDYKKEYESVTTLQVPAGYSVTRLPAAYSVANDVYAMDVSYEQKGSDIVYKKHFLIKTGTIRKADFAKWNASIASIKNVYNDQITLTRQ